MKQVFRFAFLTSAALGALACSGEPDIAGDSAEATSQEIQIEEIATVDIAGARVVFSRAGQQDHIDIHEEASIYAVETPMQQLWARKLTSLEIFKALAPEQTPPPALEAAHAREAQALGRTGTEVVLVEFDNHRAVQKAVTPAQCDIMFRDPYTSNFGPWVNRVYRDNLTGIQSQCGGNSCTDGVVYPDRVVVLGICNSSNSLLPYRVYTRSDGAPSWTYTSLNAMANSINAHYRTQTFAHNDKIEGRPTGSSVYHLRAAYAYDN